MKTVTREQFKVRSDLEVVHIPTGATFLAYPYLKTDDVVRSITVNWGRAKDKSEAIEDYVRQDIRRVAVEILVDRARRNARVRE